MKFKDSVHGLKFRIPNKATYTIDEVYELEEQWKNKVVSEIGKEFETFELNQSNTIKDLQEKLVKEQTRASDIALKQNDFEKQIKELQGQISTKEETVKKFEKRERSRTANELLNGLVVNGAEVDVFELLGDSLKSIKFEEEESIEDRKEKIKPLVEGLIKTKPYLQPVKADKNDNKALVIKKKLAVQNNDEEEEEQEDEEDTRRWGYA